MLLSWWVSFDLWVAVALWVAPAAVIQHALLQSSGILGKVQNTAEIFPRNLLVKLTTHYIPGESWVFEDFLSQFHIKQSIYQIHFTAMHYQTSWASDKPWVKHTELSKGWLYFHCNYKVDATFQSSQIDTHIGSCQELFQIYQSSKGGYLDCVSTAQGILLIICNFCHMV